MKQRVSGACALLMLPLILISSPEQQVVKHDVSNISSNRLRFLLAPIAVGEQAHIVFRWLGVTVAHGDLKLKERVMHRGRDAWHVVLEVKTTPFLDLIYPVRDEYHSYIDVETLQSLRFEKILKEGVYRADEVVEYDLEKREGYYFSRLNKSRKTFATDILIHDPISAVYWFRSLIPMEVGKVVKVPVNYEETNWDIHVPMVQEEELDFGDSRKSAIKMTPYIANLDEHMDEWEELHQEMLTKSHTSVWVEKDGFRIPLKVSVRVPYIGSVKILVSDFWSPAIQLQ